MATPAFQAVGTQVAGTAAITVAWPTHLANDIGILVIEKSGNDTTINITNPSGWAQVPGSPVVDVASTAGSKLQVWWKRAASSSETSVSVPDGGDHQIARIFTFRHCITTGNPWDVTTTGTKTTASTTATVPAVTTTVADTLITMIVGRPNDNGSTTHFDVPVNANLTGLAECEEAGSTQGNGGGFVVSCGVKATAGNTGTSTLAKGASTTDTYVVLALKAPVLLELISNTGTFNAAGINVGLLKSSTIHGTTQTYSLVGNNADFSKSVSLDVSAGSFAWTGTSAILGRQSALNVTTGSFTVGSSTLSSNLFFILNGLNTSYNLGSSSTSLLLTRRIDGSVRNLSLFQIPAEAIRRFPLNLQPSTFNLQGTGLDYFATRTLNAGSLELLVYVQTRDIVYRPNRQPFVPTPVPRGRNEWILGKFTSGGKGSFRV